MFQILTNRVGKMVGRLRHFGLPSIFDVFIVTFILILPHFKILSWNNALSRSMLLVFTSVFLMCVRLHLPKRREHKSQPLALLAIWGMVNIFYHSFMPLLRDEGTDFFIAWGTWSLLNEGFIYIFFGIYLIDSIVKYAKSWGWYYLPLMVSLAYAYNYTFGWQRPDGDWSMTPIFAVLLAGFVMLLKARKWKIALPISVVAIILGILKRHYIWIKIWSRPDFWKFTIGRIRSSKFWLGHGYYHTINTKEGLVAPETEGTVYIIERWGRGWRQSDLLEFGEYMGIIGMIGVLWFFGWLLIKGKPGLAYFLALTGVCMCLFQRTMFFPVKAALILVATSLLILEIKANALVKTSP